MSQYILEYTDHTKQTQLNKPRFHIFSTISNFLRSGVFVPCLAGESEADRRLFVEPGGLNDDGVIRQRLSRYEL